ERDEQVSRLLGAPAGSDATAPPPRPSGFDGLIHDVVAPYIVKDTSAHIASHRAATDAAITLAMRKLLHDPALQRLEAAWRGGRCVGWLVAELQLDENLQLHIFDVTREELLADIAASQGRLIETGVYRSLVDRLPEGDSWSAFVSLFQFGPTNADVALLAALGLIASKAGGLLPGDAGLALASDAAQPMAPWQALRRTEVARWIGLSAPRVLLRLPYGERTDPIETFAFEEVVGAPEPGELLWAS